MVGSQRSWDLFQVDVLQDVAGLSWIYRCPNCAPCMSDSGKIMESHSKRSTEDSGARFDHDNGLHSMTGRFFDSFIQRLMAWSLGPVIDGTYPRGRSQLWFVPGVLRICFHRYEKRLQYG